MEHLGLKKDKAETFMGKETWDSLLDLLYDDSSLFVVGHEIEVRKASGEKIAKYVCTEVVEQ